MQMDLSIFNIEVADEIRKLVDEPINEDFVKKNKYANNSKFVPESIYKRVLNRISNYRWSFIPHSIERVNDDGKPYIRYIGLLIVPGFGIHTGIGTQQLGKKDNSNATAAAKTYAFKNACKEMGIAPNVGDDDYDIDLFEHEIEEEEPPKKKEKKKGKKKSSSGKKSAPKMSMEERIDEIRQAYELESDDDFVAFLQIWDEDILDLGDMEEDDWEEFLDYIEKNKKKFEDF